MTGLVFLGKKGSVPFSQKGSVPFSLPFLLTVGAMLVIRSGSQTWINKKLIANRLLVVTGLVSYPLYLWHWPLLSIGRVLGFTSVSDRLLCLVASIILAVMTYQFVEKPVRFRSRGNWIVWLLCLLMCVMAILGLVTIREGGFPNRGANSQYVVNPKQYPGSTQAYAPTLCPRDVNNEQLGLAFCRVSKNSSPTMALLGDSHADDKFYGFAVEDGAHSWLLLAAASCPPVKGISVVADHPSCQLKSEGAIEYLTRTPSIQTVVLSFYGHYMANSSVVADHVATHKGPETIRIEGTQDSVRTKAELFEMGLESTLVALDAAEKRVVLMLDVPELPFFPRDCLRGHESCVLGTREVMDRQLVLRTMIDGIQRRHPSVLVYDPIKLFCGIDTCRYEVDGTVLYRDSHHLSEAGSVYLARHFLAWLRRH